MNKRVAGIIGAAIVAVLGTVALVVYVQGAEDRALEGEELVRVLTVTEFIPAGTDVGELESRVEVEEIPQKIAPEGVVADLIQVNGKVTAVDLYPDEPLLAQRFVDRSDFEASRGRVEVPEGLLEITVALSQEQFVGGVPVPGDYVALIAIGDRADFVASNDDPLSQTAPTGEIINTELRYSKIILQQALVTNVQGNPLPEGFDDATTATARTAPAPGSLLVTIAVTGPDAERLIYVRNSISLNADMHMALHNGEALVPTEGISVENVVNPGAPVG